MSTLVLDPLLTLLDAIRAWIYRAVGPWAGLWARDRDMRVVVLGIVTIAMALATTVIAPLWLLALGPLVLGVPHIVADLRYLWIQPGFHRSWTIWLLVVPAIALGAVTGRVHWGLLGAALALFAVPSSTMRRLMGLAVLVPLMAVSFHWQALSTLAFAHLHNVIALALWWSFRPRRSSAWVLVAFVAVSVALVAGVFDGVVDGMIATLGGPGGGRPIASYARGLAPIVDPMVGGRIVLLYAFAQSVHYGVWLRLVPEDARERPAPRPFRSTYRALTRDMGTPLLLVAALCAVALALWALVDVTQARAGYIRFAMFHGHLELAAAALLFARGQRRRTA